MKGVDGMIRLHKWQLDEKRRELAEMETMREDLLSRKAMLEQEMRAEQRFAGESEAGYAYPAYADNVMGRRHTLEDSIREIERSIEAKKFEVAKVFQELKRFEIIAERRQERERAAEAKKAQANIDEISLNMFRRANAS